MDEVNRALDLLCALRFDDGKRWGERAAQFQIRDATTILDPTAPPHVFATRPRGGSKTTDFAGISVAMMLEVLPAGSRVYVIAADLDQGKILLDSVRSFARNTAILHDAFRFTHDRATASRSDSTLQILPCDHEGLWGLRPAFVVVDEIGQWPDTDRSQERFEAVATALPKLPGRMAVITTPSAPGHWAYRLLEYARNDPLWTVHETQGPVPWISQEILESERRRLPSSQFDRLHLGVWTEPEDHLARLEDIHACVDPNLDSRPRPNTEYCIAIDLGLTHDRAVVVVAHGELDPKLGKDAPIRVVVDLLKVWTPEPGKPVQLQEVEDYIAITGRLYPGRVRADFWQAAGMIQRLQRQLGRVQGITPTATTAAQSAANLTILIRSHRLTIPDDEALIGELANVRLRETTTPGAYRIDHQPGQHDDRAIALGIAALDIIEHPPNRGPRIRGLGAFDPSETRSRPARRAGARPFR